MNELKQILRIHAEKYPAMEPQDAVKLIFQNEFGSGHMIRDAASCLAYLQEEYNKTARDTTLACYEPIGNGIYRVHLAALPAEDLDALGQAFLRTAEECKGSMEGFLAKLDVLIQLTEEGIFSFCSDALHTYLDAYRHAGFPIVSHSRAYHLAYSPAYRIIRK